MAVKKIGVRLRNVLAVSLVACLVSGFGVSQTQPQDNDLERKFHLLEKQMEELRLQMQAMKAAQEAKPTAPPVSSTPPAAATVTQTSNVDSAPTAAPLSAAPAKPKPVEPFSDWDWTWLNGNPRNKDVAFDSAFFTPEIRADITYTYSFNRPIDNSMGGSSELFRSNEIQLEQLGIGGDFHHDNVRARFMTQFGAYSAATVRNDPSPAKGQWNLNNANQYLAEAYGGYHINAMHGINIDAGIFMSYVGLFSYYNFDNWAYQPSYVSSNTPWFFQGIRVQLFPTAHLKIEPWIINGWQSYGSSNSRKGLGGQIKWTPRPWLNIVSNNYGLGHDDLYTPNRGRIHTDNSVEVRYYDKPKSKWLSETEMRTKIEKLGYTRIKTFQITGSCYEIYGWTKDGKKAEVYFNPVTGAVIKAEVD